MVDELKPCPFCGGDYDKDENDFVYSANHKKWCPLRGTSYGGYGLTVVDNEDDIIAWNTRATPIPDTPDMVRALDDAYEAGRKSAERTCKPTIEYHGDLIKTTYPCCGYELKEYKYSPYPEVAFNYCPNCGTKVVE